MAEGESGIYMGPNGVVVRDFLAGTRVLCHNKCMGKGILSFECKVYMWRSLLMSSQMKLGDTADRSRRIDLFTPKGSQGSKATTEE